MGLAYINFNVSALAKHECKDANPGNEWRCIYGQYALSYLKTPFLLIGD